MALRYVTKRSGVALYRRHSNRLFRSRGPSCGPTNVAFRNCDAFPAHVTGVMRFRFHGIRSYGPTKLAVGLLTQDTVVASWLFISSDRPSPEHYTGTNFGLYSMTTYLHGNRTWVPSHTSQHTSNPSHPPTQTFCQWCGLRPSVLGQDRSETKKIGLGHGLGLAGLVLCCTRSCHVRCHKDLEGNSNFSSTILFIAFFLFCAWWDQQWRSLTSKVKSAKCFCLLPVVLVLVLLWTHAQRCVHVIFCRCFFYFIFFLWPP